MTKKASIPFILIITCILMVLVGCSFEYRYKFLLSAYIYDVSGGGTPQGCRLNPIVLNDDPSNHINYDTDDLLEAAKDVPIIAKYTVGSSSPAALKTLIDNSVVTFYGYAGEPPSSTTTNVEMVFLYQDGFGEAYFSIYFSVVNGTFTGDIDDWGKPSGGGGWSGGAT